MSRLSWWMAQLSVVIVRLSSLELRRVRCLALKPALVETSSRELCPARCWFGLGVPEQELASRDRVALVVGCRDGMIREQQRSSQSCPYQ